MVFITLLSNKEMQKKIEKGNIEIEPAPPDEAIQPASVDLSLGGEAYRAGDDQKTELSEGDILHLPAGGLAVVLTRETVRLDPNIAGNIGLRSKYTRKGVDLLAGPQIDPGFEGPLHLTLINLSPSPIALSYGDRFCTVEFHELPEEVGESYAGQYQGQTSITTAEIRDISEKELTLSEVVKNTRNIARDISEMKKTINRLSTRVDYQMTIFLVAVITLIGSVIAKIIGVI